MGSSTIEEGTHQKKKKKKSPWNSGLKKQFVSFQRREGSFGKPHNRACDRSSLLARFSVTEIPHIESRILNSNQIIKLSVHMLLLVCFSDTLHTNLFSAVWHSHPQTSCSWVWPSVTNHKLVNPFQRKNSHRLKYINDTLIKTKPRYSYLNCNNYILVQFVIKICQFDCKSTELWCKYIKRVFLICKKIQKKKKLLLSLMLFF